MSCEKFEDRLQQLLDERRPPADDFELQQHAHRCTDCRATLLAESLLSSSLLRDIPTALPANFATRVVDTYIAERPPQQGLWNRRLMQWAALTAAALVLVAAFGTFRPAMQKVSPEAHAPFVAKHQSEEPKSDSPTPAPVLVAQGNHPPQAIQPSPIIAHPPTESLVPPKSPRNVRTHEPLTLASINTQALGSGEWIDSLRESISEVSLDDLEPMDQIADGFRPVATSLQSAVSVIRRTLPGAKEQRLKPTPDTSGVWGNAPATA